MIKNREDQSNLHKERIQNLEKQLSLMAKEIRQKVKILFKIKSEKLDAYSLKNDILLQKYQSVEQVIIFILIFLDAAE